ncbi:MAG TPA: DUF5939 domain-containing protein [bacterium]|nr:DUF5939 domain-containing protein [bacterium]
MAKPLRISREDHFAASPAVLWDLVGNTDHVNRLIGLPKVTFGAPQETAEGVFRAAATRMLGIRLDWREYAFDWVRNQSHAVLRVYQTGPLERIRMGLELTEEADGCRMRQFAEVTPRRSWPLASLPARLITRKNMDALYRFCLEHVRLRAEQPEQPFPRARPTRHVQRPALQAMGERLTRTTPANPAVVQRLLALIAEGSDEEVLRMRPFALARRWGLGRDVVLRAFLHATLVGLLELDWELMCPNCRVPKSGFHTFGAVAEHFHCDLCGTEYAAELDRTTELRFSVHPSVRQAEDAIYCIGGPHNGEHILVQQGLLRGERREVLATLPSEPLRARILRSNAALALVPDPNGAEVLALGYDGEAWSAPELRFRPGPVRLTWRNAGPAACIAVIEKEVWDPDAATAARVMAIPEFRAMFSAEVLQPGRQIGVRNLCVLFTDLKGSTALYEHVGDAPAYGRVHRHFDFLIGCFKHHEGGIVKTIGDAVMASFPSPGDALRAALEVQQRIGAFNAELAPAEPIVIKIGLHHGPAIAVNANGQMDYFGRTVNIAARIQGLSEGDDIVLSEALWAESAIQAVLAGVPVEAQGFRAALKGIEGETALVRLRFTGTGTAEAPEATGRNGAPRLFRY